MTFDAYVFTSAILTMSPGSVSTPSISAVSFAASDCVAVFRVCGNECDDEG